MKHLFLSLIFLSSFSFTTSYAQKINKKDWVANKTFQELSTYVTNISDSQKIELYKVSFSMTDKFDSIKHLKLDEAQRKLANKSVFEFRKKEFKRILSVQQFDEFVMMEAEKLEQWRSKQNPQSD